MQDIEKRLAHIEALLQHMPEIIVATYFIEKERFETTKMAGGRYDETVIVCPPNRR